IRHSYIGGGTVVRMSDTGPIPPKEILNRLFDPFFRAEAGGSDIGLFAVQRLVQKNFGTIVPYVNEERNVISLLLPSFPLEPTNDPEQSASTQPTSENAR
ncbi:MAG: ATP-binding protein, partial [bacterium]|nr:ATP-binding protein [bacterium]